MHSRLKTPIIVWLMLFGVCAVSNLEQPLHAQTEFNVREFGARGDGITVDTPAINAAIAAAHKAGGGTVVFPSVRPTVGGCAT